MGDLLARARVCVLQDGAMRPPSTARALLARDFRSTLLGFVDRAFAVPPLAHPGVTSDFWRQVEQAERLEELRRYRPSAFLALPPPPEGGEPSVEP